MPGKHLRYWVGESLGHRYLEEPKQKEVHYSPWENERNLGFGLLKNKKKTKSLGGGRGGGNRVGGRKRIGERGTGQFLRGRNVMLDGGRVAERSHVGFFSCLLCGMQCHPSL